MRSRSPATLNGQDMCPPNGGNTRLTPAFRLALPPDPTGGGRGTGDLRHGTRDGGLRGLAGV